MNTNTKKLGYLLPLVLAFTLTACQQQLTAPDPQITTQTNTTNKLEVCEDGTLNCYVDFPGNTDVTTVMDDPVNAHLTCMEDCLIAQNNDPGTPNCSIPNPFSLTAAQNNCSGGSAPTMYDKCDQVCSVMLRNARGIGFQSDPMTVPENAKAITVRIKSCIDTGPTHFQFKGPNMATRKFHQGKYRSKGFNYFAASVTKVRLPYQVGMNEDCPSELQGKAQVTFTPYKGQEPYSYNANIDIETIAFTDAVQDEITMEWKGPHLTSAQIPRELMAELDLSQMVWALQTMHSQNPNLNLIDFALNFFLNPFGINIPTYFHGFGYTTNGQLYGDSIVQIAPNTDETFQADFTMVLFVKAK